MKSFSLYVVCVLLAAGMQWAGILSVGPSFGLVLLGGAGLYAIDRLADKLDALRKSVDTTKDKK